MQRIQLEPETLFGRLRVKEFIGVSKHGKSLYRCLCECGKEIVAIVSELKNGHTQSCGCLFQEKRAAGSRTTHGRSRGKKDPIYIAWKNMRSRCNNPNNPYYANYGGRGIRICKEWDTFEIFLAAVGEKPAPGHILSIDRINNNGNYEPGNVKWSTPHEQKVNQRPRRWHKRPAEGSANPTNPSP